MDYLKIWVYELMIVSVSGSEISVFFRTWWRTVVFIVRVGKVLFLELLGSLFRKKKRIRIANQDFIILNQPGRQGGMNEKLLGSPSNRSHPKSISGFVLPTEPLEWGTNPRNFSIWERVDAAEKNRQGNARSSVGEAPFGEVFDDQLGWFCVFLIIP